MREGGREDTKGGPFVLPTPVTGNRFQNSLGRAMNPQAVGLACALHRQGPGTVSFFCKT